MFLLFNIFYKNILYSFSFSKTLIYHFMYTFMYIISLSFFRYIVLIKTNYEFSILTANNTNSRMGLMYHRMDKTGDLYRFSVGQFYEYLSINKFYNSREKIIEVNIDFIKDALGKTIYISIIYSLLISFISITSLFILKYMDILASDTVFYLIVMIFAKTLLTFISTFRIANDSISKYPVNMFINLLQVCFPVIAYYYIYPFLNIRFNFLTYVFSSLFINMLSLLAYYATLCFTIKSLILPRKVDINLSLLKDMYYLAYTTSRNMSNHIFIELLIFIVCNNISNSQKLEILYLLNAGLRNISGTFETPIDWVNRVYVSRYKDTKKFIISSYVIYAFFLLSFGYIMTILINKGIYNKLLVIKFKNSSYYHKAFLVGIMSILSKLWEVVVVANKKDNFPIIALLSGLSSYFVLVALLIKHFHIEYIDAFFYGSMINCIVQYLLFSIRGHILLNIGIRNTVFEFIRYTTLVYLFYKVSNMII